MLYKDMDFKVRYTKISDDIAADFFVPALKNAVSYDRISGYFRSTIFVIAWEGLKEFIRGGGTIRLICCPYVPNNDQNAAEEGYLARDSFTAAEALKKELDEILSNEDLVDPCRVLACLISQNALDIKIAVGSTFGNPDLKKLFHMKTGLFTDSEGNCIAFEGSMNETFSGLYADGNVESVSVYTGWTDQRDSQRVLEITREFNDLWEKRHDSVKLYDLPDEAKQILQDVSKGQHWESIVDNLIEQNVEADRWRAERNSHSRKPRKHQVNALKKWVQNGRRGILEHSTGSGKTYTALCAISKALSRHDSVLLIVPSALLLEQWYKEITNTFTEDYAVQVLLCGDGNIRWKQNGTLYTFSTPSRNRRKIVIATADTACSPDFLNYINQGDNLLIVADEVHTLGSYTHQRILTLQAGSRLGLSATPKRYGDPDGTKKLFDYFGGIIDTFTLEDAITKAKVLTPYYYYPVPILLTNDEQDKWNDYSKRISREVAMFMSSHPDAAPNEIFAESKIKRLMRERSQIVKHASGKIDLAQRLIKEHFRPGQQWIVYCDNQEQLKAVLKKINDETKDTGAIAYEYHSSMEGDQKETLRYFELNGGVLVSIKCLDEGVDIPSTTHALILASSKNPREFIQRRGRILRKADDKGKLFAYLFDAIVLPNAMDPDNIKQQSILETELARAIQFGNWAINKIDCVTKLKSYAIKYDINIEEMLEGGFEDDAEAE